MDEAVLRVLRLLADGVIGPRVHALLDELEAAGGAHSVSAPAAPALQRPPAAALPPVTTPFGGNQ